MGKHIVVSVLSYRSSVLTGSLIRNFAPMLARHSLSTGYRFTLIVRNNGYTSEAADFIKDIISARESFPHLDIRLVQSECNLGFGGGHNANFRMCSGDVFWIQNNDIGFPHIDWLHDAIDLLNDERVGAIGPLDAPRTLSSVFGNGKFTSVPPSRNVYAEGSILLLRSEVFREVGMFDPIYEWAMFEDSDLSMRLQQAGYKIKHLDMPHEHHRSAAFNAIPKETKSSIMERNRARFMSKWNTAIRNGVTSGVELFDLYSDGIGDAFAALPALFSYAKKHKNVQIELNAKKSIWQIVPPLSNIRLVDEKDLNVFDLSRYDRFATIRSINYSVPFFIGDVVASALGLPSATQEDIDAFANALRDCLPSNVESIKPSLAAGEYAVFHCEFQRPTHHGRGPQPEVLTPALNVLAESGVPIVIVGQGEKAVAVTDVPDARLIDLRGRTSLTELVALVSRARVFIGIDSLPMHIAQCFGIPSVAFFGSVTPLSRIWNVRKSYPIQAKGLECLGCYHNNLAPSIPHCLRGDEVCLKNVDGETVRNATSKALANEPPDLSGVMEEQRRWQAKHCFVQMQHPGLKSKAFGGNGVPLPEIAELLYQFIGMVEGQYDEERRGAHRAAVNVVKEDMSKKDREISELRAALDVKGQQVSQLSSMLGQWTSDGLRDSRSSESEDALTEPLPLLSLPLRAYNMIASRDDKQISLKSITEDPNIIVGETLRVTTDMPYLEFEGIAARSFASDVFYAVGSEDFEHDRRESFFVSPGPFRVAVRLPLRVGSIVRLRIDPCNEAGCELAMMISLYGFQKNELRVVAQSQ